MPGFNISTYGQESTEAGRYRFAPRANLDPIRSYRWALEKICADLASPNYNRIYDGSSSGNVAELLRHTVEVTFPTKNIDVIEVRGLHTTYKFAKAARFDDVTITFYDYWNNNLSTHAIIEEWMNDVWSPTKGLMNGEVIAYKATVHLVEFNNYGDIIGRMRLYGAWPKSISHSNLSMSSNEIKTVSVTLSIDYYIYEVVGVEPASVGNQFESGKVKLASSDTQLPGGNEAETSGSGPGGVGPGGAGSSGEAKYGGAKHGEYRSVMPETARKFSINSMTGSVVRGVIGAKFAFGITMPFGSLLSQVKSAVGYVSSRVASVSAFMSGKIAIRKVIQTPFGVGQVAIKLRR